MMKKDIFDIISEKSFSELTTEERKEFFNHFTSEEEFDGMKLFLKDMHEINHQEKPASEVKHKLDDLFDQVHGQRRPVWYMSVTAAIIPKDKPIYKQPLLYAAALIFALLMFVPLQQLDVNSDVNRVAVVDANEELPLEEMVDGNKSNDVFIEKSLEAKGEMDKVQVQSRDENLAVDSRAATGEALNQPSAITFSADAEDFDFSTNLASPAPTIAVMDEASGFDHPDGVFAGWADESNYSVPASDQPGMLDLLTTTF